MIVLGWHGNPVIREFQDSTSFSWHDAAAAIMADGKLIAAIEEERLNRVKHSNVFPARAIRFCLKEARIGLGEVDAIVTDCSEHICEMLTVRAMADEPRRAFQDGRDLIATAFEQEFDMDVREKLRFCKHHLAHLWGTWYASGFREALAVSLDGEGDAESGLVAHCNGKGLRFLRHLPEQLSLGHFYMARLSFMGYRRFDEYKVMGLAPYGDPRVFESLFRRMYELHPEGRFTILPEPQIMKIMLDAGLVAKFRRKGEPFTREHKDFAAALQATLERIAMHIIRHFQRHTGSRSLCLSGGVAHNCAMNGALLRSGLFDRVYVQPAAHDAGNAVGAALSVVREAEEPIDSNFMPHVFLGTDIGSSDEVGRELRRWEPLIKIRRVTDPAETGAELLARGLVIGWVQGRSEFGPRALGNRSILADPRPLENKRIINAMVKKREDYRPFAPSVIEERLEDYFDVPNGTERVPFMTIVLPVREAARSHLAAVTHVDGSARVQSVSREHNPRYHALIEAFGRVTGFPIVLNTSFNNNAEPIVDSVDDAVAAFLTTGIQRIVRISALM
jgi:carbamoyltransferase